MDPKQTLDQLTQAAPSFASIADKYIEMAEKLAEHTRMEAQELAKIIQDMHLANQSG